MAGWALAAAVLFVYGWVALRGPQGLPALMERRREVRRLEERLEHGQQVAAGLGQVVARPRRALAVGPLLEDAGGHPAYHHLAGRPALDVPEECGKICMPYEVWHRQAIVNGGYRSVTSRSA